jgi:hypothetical protein
MIDSNTLIELIECIYGWRKDNISYNDKLSSSDLAKFAKYVQKQISDNQFR